MEDEATAEVTKYGTTVTISGSGKAALEALRKATAVRVVQLEGSGVTSDALRLTAELPEVDAVLITGAVLKKDQFALLDPLPLGAVVKVEKQKKNDRAWAEFRRRRDERAAQLEPEHRPEAAARFARGMARIGHSTYDPTLRRIKICYGDARDEDMRYVGWMSDLEELQFRRAWGISTKALGHLSGLSRLKTLNLNGVRFVSSLAPLAGCTALESLDLFPDEDTYATDDHSLGLERLTSLRRLKVWDSKFADQTLKRIGALTQLRYLSLTLGELQDENSLRALAGLVELEMLELMIPTELSDECLRHFSGLTKLRSLRTRADLGKGDGLRYLAGLSSLQYLTLDGEAVTDAGLNRLDGLTALRVVQVPWTRVTKKGAARLAAALPDVAVHRAGSLAKSPRQVVRFRRRTLGGFASALIPTDWAEERTEVEMHVEWVESGFEQFGNVWAIYSACVSPAAIEMWIEDDPTEPDGMEYVRECARNGNNRVPKALEKSLTQSAHDSGVASGLYKKDDEQCLTAAGLRDGRAAALTCKAPPSRFKEFAGLFQFVAASFRVGPDALARDGEEVEVAAAELG